MPQTARLNKPINCYFCTVQVNPYILEKRDKTLLVECPSCKSEIVLPKIPNE